MRLALLAPLLLTAACATAPAWDGQARALMAAGKCEDARRLVANNEPDPSMKFGFIGASFADCDRNMSEAVRYWTLSARYGNTWAQETLAKLGKPVPPADLQQARQPTAAESFMKGYSQGGSRLPDTSSSGGIKTCDTRRTTMGSGPNQSFDVTCR